MLQSAQNLRVACKAISWLFGITEIVFIPLRKEVLEKGKVVVKDEEAPPKHTRPTI